MNPVEQLLTSLQTLLTPLATGTATLFTLPPDPDEMWALTLIGGPTEPLGRWGLSILQLHTRGERGNPLGAHGAADPLVRRLMALTGVSFGSVAVNTVTHQGFVSAPDASKRTVRTDSFLLDLDYQA